MLTRREDAAAHLAAIVESSDDAIVGHDLDGFITSWNRAAERMFGYNAAEAIGKHISFLIPEDRRPEHDSVLTSVRAGRGLTHYECRRRKDGNLIEVSVTVSPIGDAAGDIIGASRISRDVSGHRRIERDALRLAAIVESSDDAIVGKDLQGIIQTWNKGAERIFGYTAAEVVGQSIMLIIPEDRREEETDVLARIRAGLSVDHFETVRRRKDGELIEISLTVSPIRTASGEVIGASKIARDISGQKLLQRAVEEAGRAKDQFLATLSHELRTPLNTVLGYTAMLRSAAMTDEQRARALEVIGRNADALTQLVNDVLDTSRIVTGKLRLELRPCDVSAVVEEAIAEMAPTVAAKGLTVTSEIDAGQMVQGDRNRLRQILWNLLSNAVKFTPSGGRIIVKVARRDGSVRIAVEDTGIGLTQESLPLVFRRFWQADEAETREQSGLGLGLALVRHFVELHGGDISAQSPGAGRGATFVIMLPALSTRG